MRSLASRVATIAVLLTAASVATANPSADPSTGPSIEEWLSLTSWTPQRLSTAASESPRSAETREALLDLARRFERLPDQLQQPSATTDAANESPRPGTVIELNGHATAAEPVAGGFRLQIKSGRSPQPATVLTPSAPQAWTETAASPLSEPASLRGIVIAWNDQQRLIVTPHVEWRPTSAKSGLVNLGAALLGRAGMDLGVLDQLVDRKPLTPADTEPFYQALAACGSYGPSQLLRAAGENLPAYEQRWQARLNEEQSNPRLAATVLNRVRGGHYSVAPLFLDSRQQRGELLAFEGVVRRVVRIDLATRQRGIDHYFELELFPYDSQDLPLVFCVRELPDGFPIGDATRQRARIAGFFLKRWAYRTRKPSDTGGDRRQLAPLLVSPGPVLLANAAPPRDNRAALLVGFGFVGVVATVAIALWRQALSDRRFEQRVLSRYTTGDRPQPQDSE